MHNDDTTRTPSELVLLHAGQFARFERQFGRGMLWLFFAATCAVAPFFVTRSLIATLRAGAPVDWKGLAIAGPTAVIGIAFAVAAFRAVFRRNPIPE